MTDEPDQAEPEEEWEPPEVPDSDEEPDLQADLVEATKQKYVDPGSGVVSIFKNAVRRNAWSERTSAKYEKRNPKRECSQLPTLNSQKERKRAQDRANADDYIAYLRTQCGEHERNKLAAADLVAQAKNPDCEP